MNYNYVIDSSFQPFSMQEMLVPLTAYKDAYEKDEERYLELQNKAGDLAAVVASLPEGSAVRKQYENYYNELNERAKEFSNNGKSFSTGKALLDLRRRYQGEIGSIEKANNALNEELKLRRTIMAQDPTMLYNMENPTLENYMPGAKRNDYSISGNYLSAEGAKMGEALSKRIFTTEEGKNNILGGYYIDYVQRTGVRDTKAFMQSPEFAEAMKEDLMSKGVYDNLSGNNLQRAIDAYRSGAMKGFVYSEQHSPQRDLGKMTASEQAADARAAESLALNAASNGMEKVNGKWVYNPKNDPAYQKAVAVAQLKGKSGGSGGSSRVPAYDKLAYVSGGGSKYVEEIPGRAKKVNVEIKDGKYEVSVGDGKNKLVLGSMNAKGDFTLGKDVNYEKFAQHFDSGMSWYQLGHTYDPDSDNANIQALLQDIVETAKREGGQSYKNYNYYLEPDNVGYNNGGGGFYREPMSREYGTTSNEDLADFEGGYGE